MSFHNLSYVAFLPLAAVCYLKAPKKVQPGVLLAASLWFYWCNRPAAASWGLGWQLLPMGLLVAVSLFCWALGRACLLYTSRSTSRSPAVPRTRCCPT